MNARLVALSITPFLLFGSAAFAQSSAPMRPAPAPATSGTDQWTGLYFGANLGHASGNFSAPISFAPFTYQGQTQPGESVTVGPSGGGSVALGVEVGYGIKLGSALLADGELSLSHASPTITQAAGDQAQGLNYFIPADTFTIAGGTTTSLRARIGTTMRPDLFVYGTVGVAIVNVSVTGAFPAVGSFPAENGAQSHTMKGLTIGVGAEYAPFKEGSLRAVTIGAEFRHASLGTVTFDFGDVDIFQPPPVVEPALGAVTASENEFDVRVNVRLKLWR